MRNRTALLCSLLLLGLVAPGLTACDGGGGGLEAASAQAERVANAVETARTRVEQRETELKDAMAALEEARDELAKVETELAEARQQVEEAVSDNDLFRDVQKALLENEALEGHAISARVRQRVVTLEGTVPDEALKTQAEEIAAASLGVATVVNQIRVETPAAAE